MQISPEGTKTYSSSKSWSSSQRIPHLEGFGVAAEDRSSICASHLAYLGLILAVHKNWYCWDLLMGLVSGKWTEAWWCWSSPSSVITISFFLQYLPFDITVNCICEIHCSALDGFDHNTVHKLSSEEKKYWGTRIWTTGCWAGSKNSFSVLCSPHPSVNKS